MKLTLIKPKLGHSHDFTYKDKAVMEPLVMAILASLTPPDVDVKFYDDRIENIPFEEATDLVAITVESFTARRAYEISAEYRKRGVPVILGGYHPSHVPDESILYADSVYIGDAEDKWASVIADFKKGQLKKIYKGENGIPDDDILPKREIFNGKKYLPIALVQFSRGCKFDCNFCSVSSFYDKEFYHKKIENVIKDIESQDKKLILFVDDNIVMNHKVAKELFIALAPLKIKWASEADINMANDLELMSLMVKSGCIGHLVGFESIEEKNLISMNKRPNLVEFDYYKEKLEIIKDHGLFVWAAFTMGHDYDTLESIERTLEFSLKHKFVLADYNVLMPYPMTPLYNQLAKENRLLFDGQWWLHPEYRFGKTTFVPARISPEELEDGCFVARKKYFTIPSIIKRGVEFKVNMKSFNNLYICLLMNSLSYNDAIKKQDIILGNAGRLN